ncbi:DUF397 domain-containing protein [Streptomyces rimosus]|uniref:DUF397 domain-containing protein n=1 Tax=Streptomyces rimosus TaxID=1927 RepID=UPI00099B39F4|nr:DUF397 domain-containing protein [Streptomyces rimosus]
MKGATANSPWQVSSHCQAGNSCIGVRHSEAPPHNEWQKPSESTDAEGNSVEVTAPEGQVLIRESDRPQVFIKTSQSAMRAFLARVRESRNNNTPH